MGRRGRWSRGLWIAASSFVAAALLAEVLVRLAPPRASYSEPMLRLEDGDVVPLTSLADCIARWSAQERPRADVTCRVCYDRPRWDYFDADGCVEMSTNSIGLREQEIGAREPGELRLLAVGDSFTFGLGVARHDTWPKALERRLAADHEGPVFVINGGLCGGGMEPAGYEAWILDEGFALEPDVLLLGFCLNDVGREVRLALLPPQVQRPWLGGASHLLSFLQQGLAEMRFERQLATLAPERKARAIEQILTREGSWDAARAAIVRIDAAARERGVRFVVVVFPMLTRLLGDYPFAWAHEVVEAFCREQGIEHVDTLASVLAHARQQPGFDDEDVWVHATDQHPNPVAQDLFAAAVHRYLTGARR